MRPLAAIACLVLLAAPVASWARGAHAAPGRGTGPGASASLGSGTGTSCPSGARTHHTGAAVEQLGAERRMFFQRQAPCPSTGKTHGSCPGYVIADVPPAKRGGAWSMRWMTPEEVEAVDRESR